MSEAAFPNPFEAMLAALEERVRQVVRQELLEARDESVPTGWLDVHGAADYLATSPEGIRGLVKRQVIPAHRLGGRLLFDPQELDDEVRRG